MKRLCRVRAAACLAILLTTCGGSESGLQDSAAEAPDLSVAEDVPAAGIPDPGGYPPLVDVDEEKEKPRFSDLTSAGEMDTGGATWCGDGACAGAGGENCGNCPADCVCACGEMCDWDACVFINCEGKECGDDGCGGICGQCGEGEECVGGKCGATEYAWACSPIGNSYSDGFFYLAAFKGKLYSGQFGYGHEAKSMLFSYPPWELTSPGLKGISESVCAMELFEGYLYANTESSGDIFRSADGSHWEKVYDGDSGSIGCAMTVFKGKLYAVNYRNSQEDHGRILRQDGATWTTVYDSGPDSLYLREIAAYKDHIYAFAVMNDQGQMLKSNDGSNWTKTQVANRYFRAHVWDGYLWLGSTDFNVNGERGLWRFDGNEFDKIHPGAQKYVSNVQDLDGSLFFSTSNGWKNEGGPSTLWMSPDGYEGWKQICQFGETAIWDLTVFDGKLYMGSWDYGGSGKVYVLDKQAL